MSYEHKISIIVPVYNNAQYIEKLINSIITQSYSNYELIIINDGSTDNSLSIINNYINICSNIICKTIENSGPGVARKHGFELCTGDLLFFIDSDDYLPNNNILQKINSLYLEKNFDVLFFDYYALINKRKIRKSPFYNCKKIGEGIYNINMLYNYTFDGALWQKIFIRKKVKQEFFINSSSYEDYYFTYLYLNYCSNFYYTNEIMYYANRDNSNSISKKFDSKKIENSVNILLELYQLTTFKMSLSLQIYDFYNYSRRKVDKSRISKLEKKKLTNTIKKLKKCFTLKELILVHIKPIDFLKYFYYFFRDICMR